MAGGKRELIDTGTDKRFVRRDETFRRRRLMSVNHSRRIANARRSTKPSQDKATAVTGSAD
jgi:hypothetical protein